MVDGSGLSRGDRNRNGRLFRLRGLLPVSNAVVGIDLAQVKQAAVVCDHNSRVLARRRVSARAWELGTLLDWAVQLSGGAEPVEHSPMQPSPQPHARAAATTPTDVAGRLTSAITEPVELTGAALI